MADEKTIDHLLLGVGAMKAGTTWIFDALSRHPDIHSCPEKEIHYLYARHVHAGMLSERARIRRSTHYLHFDPETAASQVLQKRVRWVANYLDSPINDTWFNNLFLDRGDARWVADFSNMTARLPVEAWQDLHARTEKLRVIYTLRAPMDRLWSHVRHQLNMHNRTEELSHWSLDELEDYIRTGGDFLAHSDYAAVIARMQAALPPECVHVDFFDRIPTQARAFIADIERFLDLPPNPLPDDLVARVVNPSPPRALPDGLAERFQDDIAAQITGLGDLGISIPQAWHAPPA